MSNIFNSNIQALNPNVTLLKGQRVIKVGDHLFPVGVGGNFMPGGDSTTELSTTYYKCQSVDTSTNTWAGYEAYDKGTYFTFAEIPTTGLSYLGVAPEVGSIYSSDGRVKVAGLFDGVMTDDTGDTTVYLAGDTTISGTTATVSTGSVSNGVYTM